MAPKRDLFLISLALSFVLPIPSCRSNSDLLVGTRGRRDLLSTKLVLLDGLSHWPPSLIILPFFRRFGTLNSFLAGASSPESEPISANFLSNSSEDFLLTCWTVAELAESIIEKWEKWPVEFREKGDEWWCWKCKIYWGVRFIDYNVGFVSYYVKMDRWGT